MGLLECFLLSFLLLFLRLINFFVVVACSHWGYIFFSHIFQILLFLLPLYQVNVSVFVRVLCASGVFFLPCLNFHLSILRDF